ncbi:MAG: ABC transporter ATP-binding protein [Clostridiales bacterium]|nr:ABC transporter ATP-binding protein [Clostridiales bacterium]
MIEVKNLTKQYGNHTAVSDLSFTITPGKIYGFLGPNGAGKTTTMNIITGCLAATSGEVKIGGYDIFEQPKEAKSLVGYLPEVPPLYMDQTPGEYLHFVARAKGMKRQEIQSELAKVIAETKIEEVADKMIRHLSKGYRQRVGIAQALLGNPEIIILDEPTVGLDPAQIIEIRELIKMLGRKHTVILSSHILSEIQAICDEVLIIHKGHLVVFDKLENLGKALSAGNMVEVCCETSATKMRKLLAPVKGITSIKIQEESKTFCSALLSVGDENPTEVCREVFLAYARDGAVLQKLNPVTATLEDIFMKITSDQGGYVPAVNTETQSEAASIDGNHKKGAAKTPRMSAKSEPEEPEHPNPEEEENSENRTDQARQQTAEKEAETE